jgi:hypothetical protein
MVTSELNASPRQIAACSALIYNVLQRGEPRPGSVGMALALVSAHPGAGVSLVTRLIEELLNENAAGSAICLDCCSLGIRDAEQRSTGPIPAATQDADRPEIANCTRLGKYRDRADHLNSLRDVYRYVLLDCHSLKEKTDILGLAPLVDGILMVLEGDRTTRSQLNYLERSIEEYGGNILGCVLNKRTYPIPKFVFGWMERIGF